MFLNVAKSFSSIGEEFTDPLEFELLPHHIEQADKLDKKVENRVRNVFKLGFASVIRDLTEAVSVSEVYNDDTFKKKMTLKYLQEYEDLKTKKDESNRWKKLKEDLSWFVIYNEKLKSSVPQHFQRKRKKNKIMEANGIYYRKVLLKKRITLKLVRWFKKRMGIKVKLSGEKMKRRLHIRKYVLMKPLIIRRLLKDIIACGFYSFMRERLIEILYDRKRKQLNKMKKAEKKYKTLVKFYQQKLAEANKFAVARRKIRERLIQLKILRIKTDVKSRIFKHLKRFGFSSTREAEDFHISAMKHLQKLQKTGVSSTDHLVHFKSLNSDTFIKTIFIDLAKQGKLNVQENSAFEALNVSKHELPKSRPSGTSIKERGNMKVKKKQLSQRVSSRKTIPFLKAPITESIQSSAQHASKLQRSSSNKGTFHFKPFKIKYKNGMNRRKKDKPKTTISRKTNKTRRKKQKYNIQIKKKNRKLLKTHKNLSNNIALLKSETLYSPTSKQQSKVRRNKQSFGSCRRISLFKMNGRKFPSVLKDRKLKTCTQKLIKATPYRKKQMIKVKDSNRSDKLKRRLHEMKKCGKSVLPGHSSDQLSTIFYKGLVDSLRSMVSHKSSVGSTSNHTQNTGSDGLDKQSGSDGDKASYDYSTTGGQAPPKKRANLTRKQLASERMEAEKKRLEETVLRSVETRFKEMMMDVPKDKDLRITNKLGGYLARHAWRRFYMGKNSPCERVCFQPNSRNKPPPWGHYRLYRPLVYNRKTKYYLVVHGFDLTPRKFRSKRYPSCPVSYDALWFFSNILRDSKLRRNRIKYKYDFLRKDSSISQHSGSRRFTFDEKSMYVGTIVPHLVFREEEVFSQETEEDDVPPMFMLRHDLKSSEPEDRQSLEFRIFLTETETIELITIESQHNFVLIEKETPIILPEFYKPEKKLSKFEFFKKKRKKNVFIDGTSTLKSKTEKEELLDISITSKPEKSLTELDSKTFESRGVQVVTKTSRTTKVQVNPPTRKNASTLVTLFDFIAEANKEKTTDLFKSIYSKVSENEGSTSSDESEKEKVNDPLLVTKSSDFRDALGFVERILASNIYKKSQMFYARYHVDPLSGKLPISYECVHLWTFHDYRIQLSQMIVSSIAPHPFDNNIIAVAYAKNELATRDFGVVCIWNIKNVFFPEQVIKFTSSVNYIEFSHPTTISVALMGGFVAIINITKKTHKITMNTERTTTAGFLPIWQFSWFLEENGEKFPVSCGADGRIYRYRTDETFAATILFEVTPIENKLRGFKKVDNFPAGKWKERPEMTACAQHPTDRQSYLVGTSEGTVHICSLLLRNHLEVFLAQEGRINAIKFHPHCEHVFLTVGGDFCVRIWAIGIYEPLLTYSSRNEYIEDACFNEIWPELMISISGEFVDIWNIRRRVCVPVQSWSNPKQLKNTCIRFSTDGYSVIVGDIGGYVHSFRLCEMPCESKMKAEVLSQAIMSTLSERQDLIAALSKLGYPFSVTHIENFLKAGSSRKSDVL